MPGLMILSATLRRTGCCLLGHVDDAHAPFADLLQQLVGADRRARRLGRGGRRSPLARLRARGRPDGPGSSPARAVAQPAGARPASRSAASLAAGLRRDKPATASGASIFEGLDEDRSRRRRSAFMIGLRCDTVQSCAHLLVRNETLDCPEDMRRNRHASGDLPARPIVQLALAARPGRKPSGGRRLRGEMPEGVSAASASISPAKIAELDQLGRLRVLGLRAGPGPRPGRAGRRPGPSARGPIERPAADASAAAAAWRACLPRALLDQDPPHRLGRGGEEMAAAIPVLGRVAVRPAAGTPRAPGPWPAASGPASPGPACCAASLRSSS